MDDINNIIKDISKLYNKLTFLDKYGNDFFIAIFLIIIFVIILSYFTILNNIETLKKDWINNRCKANIIPFAGIINAPDGTSILDYTIQNFNNCINNISKNVSEKSMQPFYYLVNLLALIVDNYNNASNNLKYFFYNMRENISDIAIDINSKAYNFTPPFIQMILIFKDTVNKIKGIFASLIFSLYGSYLSLQGVTRVMYDSSVAIIVLLVAFIVGVMFIPVIGWAIAIPLLAFFGLVIVPLAETSMIMKKVLKLTNVKNVPSGPPSMRKRCFHPNTKIKLKDNIVTFMKNLKIGDILYDGSIVEGIMKTSPDNHDFYLLRDIIVTSTHKVFDFNNSKWIFVNEHFESKKYENYDKNEMYCISTNTKVIKINDLYFTDWDELEQESIEELRDITIKLKNIETNSEEINKEKTFTYNDIHKYFDGGFSYNTPIELINGKIVNICNIKLNDVLKHGEKVVGIIKIDGKNISKKNICEYYLDKYNNKLFIGSNIILFDTYNKIIKQSICII
jgi:hypothetical protein